MNQPTQSVMIATLAARVVELESQLLTVQRQANTMSDDLMIQTSETDAVYQAKDALERAMFHIRKNVSTRLGRGYSTIPMVQITTELAKVDHLLFPDSLDFWDEFKNANK